MIGFSAPLDDMPSKVVPERPLWAFLTPHGRAGRVPARVQLGEAVEVFIRREDVERFIDEVRGDEPELAMHLRIEERELEAGL